MLNNFSSLYICITNDEDLLYWVSTQEIEPLDTDSLFCDLQTPFVTGKYLYLTWQQVVLIRKASPSS